MQLFRDEREGPLGVGTEPRRVVGTLLEVSINHISRACLHNNHSSPQHQRYPRDPQHSTPKGFLLYHSNNNNSVVVVYIYMHMFALYYSFPLYYYYLLNTSVKPSLNP
jgi:hypothetical protein